MVLITQEEVIFSEYDLDTQIRTIHYHEIRTEVDMVTCVMEMWLEEHQKDCIEGLAKNVLSGI